MAIRNLCYKHNCEEFDKLPDALRPVAAEWRTVSEEKCEMCQEKRLDDLRAALETILGFLDEMAAFLDGDLAVWAETCRHTARAALARSGEAGNEV